MSRAIVIFLILALTVKVHKTARIFAWFPTPSISHQVVFRPLTQELAKRGHDVIVLTTDPVFPNGKTPKNLTEIDVHDISYSTWRDVFMSRQNEMTDDISQQLKMLAEAATEVTKKQINIAEMENIIKGREKFDLLLIEGVGFEALALKHVIKVPVVIISSFGPVPGQMEAFGAPVHHFLYPLSLRKRVYNLSIWEKLQELYLIWKIDCMTNQWQIDSRKMLSKYFGEDLPPLGELIQNIDLLLLNENPVWGGVRPVPPNVVYIGGIHRKSKKDLPEDLKRYLDSSKRGVIYMSFGTNVDPSMLPPEKIQAFVKAFSALPYDVLWKWNEDELPGRTKNIKISKWLPQSDLLYHPNVKLFITQAGLQSTDEAINAGVPVIGVPMLADQWYNAEHYVHHRVGLQLDIRTLDADVVKNAVETVIGDPSYRDNMVRIRNLMRDEPMPPLERAVWWTEHVLRHGGARHLRAPAANMPWTHYYELDLVLLVVGAILVLLLLAIVIVHSLVKLLSRSFRRDKVKYS